MISIWVKKTAKFDKEFIAKNKNARLKYHLYVQLLDNTRSLETFQIILRVYWYVAKAESFDLVEQLYL